MVAFLRRLQTSRIVQNTSWIFAGNILWVVMSFGASIVVARQLGVQEYGLLQLATTWFLFIQLFENLAHPNVSKIEMVKNPDKVADYIYAIGFIVAVLALVFVLILGLFYIKFRHPVVLYVLIMTVGLCFKVYSGVVYSLDNQLRAAKTQVVQFAGNFAATLYRVFTAYLCPLALPQTFAVLVTNIACFVVSLRYLPTGFCWFPKEDLDFSVAKELLRKSAPLFAVSLISLMVYRQDILILGFFGMEREIALYSNAVKISEPWGFIAAGVVSSLLPGIVVAKSRSLGLYYRRLRLLFFVLTCAALGLAVCVSFFASTIVSLTYGSQYMDAVPLLRIHIWSNLFLFYVTAQQVWETNESLFTFLIFKTSGAAALNLILNLILIPQYGVMACAVTSVITYFFLGFGFNLAHKKARFINYNYLRALVDWRGHFKREF